MQKMISECEREELESLRAYKKAHEGNAINRAFKRLEQLLDMPAYDPVMSRRAFKVVADCLLTLKEEVEGMK
jgi:hypothetical protein